MNKKLIAMATAAALALPVTAVQAGDVSVSGFADTVFTISDENADPVAPATLNLSEKKFNVSGEVDVTGSANGVTGRIDLDVADTTTFVEQAFFAWEANDQFTLVGGRFNNPAGLEEEDAPNMFSTTNGQINTILNGQTAIGGNNVEGVAGIFNLGAASVTVGILDDLQNVAEENSYIISATGEIISGLNVEGTFVSQQDYDAVTNPASAGNLFDINGTFSPSQMAGLTVAAEFATASDIVDTAWGLWGVYAFNPMFSGTVRYDNVSYSSLPTTPATPAAKDSTSLTLSVAAAVEDNLSFLLEWRNDDDGTNTNATVMLEAIVTAGDFE